MFLLILANLFDMFIDLREREKHLCEKETSLVASHSCLDWGGTQNPGMFPDPE